MANKFDFLQNFIDPNSIFIRNNYVYFKHSRPKPIADTPADTGPKVKEVTPAEYATQIAESKEQIETGKRKLPDNPAIERPGDTKKRRKRAVIAYEPDALD